jgi:outer membrane protein TolC
VCWNARERSSAPIESKENTVKKTSIARRLAAFAGISLILGLTACSPAQPQSSELKTDNYQLSMKSQRAGEIGLLDLIVVNRQALDARRDLLDALLEYQTTRAALEAAAGWSPEGINR